jgi:hypothetical protein
MMEKVKGKSRQFGVVTDALKDDAQGDFAGVRRDGNRLQDRAHTRGVLVDDLKVERWCIH